MDGQMTEHQAKEIMESAESLSYCFNTSRLWIDREDLVGIALMAAVKCYKRWDEARGPFITYAKSIMYYAMLENVRTLIQTRGRKIRKYEILLSQMAQEGRYDTLVAVIPASEEPNMFELRDELGFWKQFFQPLDWVIMQERYMGYKCDREIAEDLDMSESGICLRRKNAIRKCQILAASFVCGR